MFTTKIGENTSNILNCLFQNKLTLYHIKLNIFIWKTKFTSHEQYLFVPPFSRHLKMTNTDQIMYRLSYSVWKVTTYKPSNVAVVTNVFSSAYVIGTTCLYECLLFYLISEKYHFQQKFIVTLIFFSTAMFLFFLKQLFWKKSVFYIISIAIVQYIVLLKFQKSCRIIYIC